MTSDRLGWLGRRAHRGLGRRWQLALPARRGLLIPRFQLAVLAVLSLGQALLRSVLPHVSPPPPVGFHAEHVLAAVIADRRRRDAERLARDDQRLARLLPPDQLGA